MISLTTNTRGMTKMTKKFSEMKGKELVSAYNELAKKAGKPAVTRFATAAAGIKRCEALAGSGPKKATAAADGRSKILIEFDARTGTNRAKLIDALHGSYRKMVPVKALLKSCYGSMNEENRGALNMVLKGANDMIKKQRLPYQIKKEKDKATKEVSFGLYPKN